MPPPESARISTLRRRWRGSWASASRVASIWSAAVFDPALPARSTMASGSPFPSGAVVGEGGQGVMAVKSARGAVPAFRPARFPRPLPAPGVPLSGHRALRMPRLNAS